MTETNLPLPPEALEKDSQSAEVIEFKPNSVMAQVSDSMRSFEKAVSEDTPEKRAEAFDRLFHANLGKFTTGLSPAALMVAYTDWWAHFGLAPNKRLQVMESAWRKTSSFWQNVSNYYVEKDTGCFDIEDKQFKQRFKEDHWKQWPYCAMAQAYLQAEDWWQEATDVRGVQQNHKDMVSFMRYQWMNALSPENNPFLNPHLLERTENSHGENLLKGWRNYIDDIHRWLVGDKPAGVEDFVVGKDVATTEGKVVYRNDLLELIQYTPKTDNVYPEPVLIAPAWIMKYYVLDLSPENSMVGHLVSQGHTVFMISWKNPDAEYRDYGMEDYMKKGVLEALDAVCAITGQKQVHATGYCIGGTLLSIAASYMARHNDNRLKSMTLFAAQTDFEKAGELTTFIDENQLSYLEDIMYEQGYLRGDQMSAAFTLLQPKELVWSKAMHEYLMGERLPLIDLLAWNKDTTRLPYKMHSEYLRHLYLNNELSEGDYRVEGEPITLEDIEAPMFVVSTEKDHIAPWKSVYKIHLYTMADITFVLTNKGHNGGIVSEPGHEGRSFRMGYTSKDTRYIAPGKWYRDHEPQDGSWWPKWHDWLAEQSGEKVKPPQMGAPDKGYEILCDAPGTYVLES